MSIYQPSAPQANARGFSTANLGGVSTSPNRAFAFAFGAVYALVGLAGFLVTKGVPFSGQMGKNLIVFPVNPLHNLVHIAVGALFIVGALAGEKIASGVNALIGGVYLAVGVAGLFVIGTKFNIIALNQADNALHFATAILALGIGAYGLRHKQLA